MLLIHSSCWPCAWRTLPALPEKIALQNKNWSKYSCKKKFRPFLQKFWLKTTATDQTSKLKHKQLHFGHLRVKLPAFTSLAKVSQRIHTISANKINPTPRKHFIIFCLMISCPTCPPAWSRSWPAPRTASPSTWSGRAQGCCTPRCTLGTAPPFKLNQIYRVSCPINSYHQNL